jgi:hypothetical protein
LTVARGRSHDETHFNQPRRITAAPPPTPYLDVRREPILRRLAAKEVLRRAFLSLPEEDDAEAFDSVHGEFGPPGRWPGRRPHVAAWLNDHPGEVAEIVDALLRQTALAEQRPALLEFLHGPLLGSIDDVAADASRYPQPFLSERLANAGLLPMFGMPTRVRYLYQRRPEQLWDLNEHVIDRELEVAISQFAPGSETVKDKTVYTAAGVVFYRRDKGKVVEEDGRGPAVLVGSCAACGALAQAGEAGALPAACPVCKRGEPTFRAVPCWEPRGFTVEPRAETDFDGTFEWTPRATPARLGCGEYQPFQPIAEANLEFYAPAEPITVVTLNDNDGALFTFRNLRGRQVWAAPAHLQADWLRGLGDNEVRVGLAARLATDVLLVRLQADPPGLDLNPLGARAVYARAAFHSFGQLFRKAACDYLDVEPGELAVNLRPMDSGGRPRFEVFLMDTLENGAGYCRHLAEDADRLRAAVLAPLVRADGRLRQVLAGHADRCDGACYDCLRAYDNVDLHPLLDWRLGLDVAELALGGAAADLGRPHWQGMAERAARALARWLPDAAAVAWGPFWTVQAGGRIRAVLIHPLWAPDHPVLQDLAKRLGAAPPFCTVFDALRRPGWFVAQQGDAPGVPAPVAGRPAKAAEMDPERGLGDLAGPLPARFRLRYHRPNLPALVPTGGLLAMTALAEDDPLPEPGRVVLVRHPSLPADPGDGVAGVAVGQWWPREFFDEGNNLARVEILLRAQPELAAPPRRLRLRAEEWRAFRPLARLAEDVG